MAAHVRIGPDRDLALDDLAAVAAGARVVPDEASLGSLDRASELAEARAQAGRIYGYSTGFGPMVDRDVPHGSAIELQYNLVRSHAAGLGDPLSPALSRAIVLARLQSLVRNRSAVPGALVRHLAELLNAGLAPFVPRKGGVGASGDLVQLAHVALLAIGEGKCWQGKALCDAGEAYARLGLQPYRLRFRDGLAMVNGTSAMVALGANAVTDARRLFDMAVSLSSLLVELTGASHEPFSEALNGAKRHSGQAYVATRMRHQLAGGAPSTGTAQLQAPYSIRCVPQIVGPMFDALEYVERAVLDELNSVSDNPIFDPATGAAAHGGNFHGEQVAQAMDVLKISVVKCTLLLERQLNLLLNDDINRLFPPFVNLGRPGIELGMQGAQFTATSTAAENQSLAFPMSVHSIPGNKDNQDVVSMGFNAAYMCLQTLDNAFDVAAILALALSQAAAARPPSQMSAGGQGLIDRIRAIAPPFAADAILHEKLTGIAALLRGAALQAASAVADV